MSGQVRRRGRGRRPAGRWPRPARAASPGGTSRPFSPSRTISARPWVLADHDGTACEQRLDGGVPERLDERGHQHDVGGRELGPGRVHEAEQRRHGPRGARGRSARAPGRGTTRSPRRRRRPGAARRRAPARPARRPRRPRRRCPCAGDSLPTRTRRSGAPGTRTLRDGRLGRPGHPVVHDRGPAAQDARTRDRWPAATPRCWRRSGARAAAGAVRPAVMTVDWSSSASCTWQTTGTRASARGQDPRRDRQRVHVDGVGARPAQPARGLPRGARRRDGSDRARPRGRQQGLAQDGERREPDRRAPPAVSRSTSGPSPGTTTRTSQPAPVAAATDSTSCRSEPYSSVEGCATTSRGASRRRPGGAPTQRVPRARGRARGPRRPADPGRTSSWRRPPRLTTRQP